MVSAVGHAMVLKHPKPVPAQLSRLKNWPLQHLILPLNFFFSMVQTYVKGFFLIYSTNFKEQKNFN